MTELAQQALEFICLDPQHVTWWRGRQASFWRQRALDLKDASLDMIASLPDPFIRRLFLKNVIEPRGEYRLGEFVHLALMDEFRKVTNAPDSSFRDLFRMGLPIVELVLRSFLWPPKQDVAAPAFTTEELEQRAWEERRQTTRKLASSRGGEHAEALWCSTLEERDKGSCLGPFL